MKNPAFAGPQFTPSIAPTLTGLRTTVSFAENTVNATPQVIDTDVTFTDPNDDYNGGTLVVTGLLAEDRVSIRNGVVISVSGGVVYYDADGVGGAAAVAIGTVSGGVGAAFNVTFNASATSTMIDALIQNLTYANVSDTPTLTRTLTFNVTDAAGHGLASPLAFTARTGGSNPLSLVELFRCSSPTFADVDGDGDLDALVGSIVLGGSTSIAYFQNTGSATAPTFVQRTGEANPFSTIHVFGSIAEKLADLDGDGDLDLVVGEENQGLYYFENTGTAQAPTFVGRNGADNPFTDLAGDYTNRPAFVDIDGDGDLDAFVGSRLGRVRYLENTGTKTAPAFTLRYSGNPLVGASVNFNAAPVFGDIDGDGDQDVVIGNDAGTIAYYENIGTRTSPLFAERTGEASPFSAIDLGFRSQPALADLDGDGDLDLIVGDYSGGLFYFLNTMSRAPSVTVTVTPEPEGIVGGSESDTLIGTAGGDEMHGLGGADTLNGLGGADLINGEDGDDYIDGGAGADTMVGGAGNDTFVVDNAGDIVTEGSNGGTDTVRTGLASYTLADNVENLTGTSASGQTLNGNALNNVITGGGKADTINGGGGNDWIIGGAGFDTLIGGGGADTFVLLNSDVGELRRASGADVINDFSLKQGDRIDLSAIDANINLGGDQAFEFVRAFTKHAGEALLTFDRLSNSTKLSLDVNGDGRTDFDLVLKGGDFTRAPIVAGENDGGWIL